MNEHHHLLEIKTRIGIETYTKETMVISSILGLFLFSLTSIVLFLRELEVDMIPNIKVKENDYLI
jgi:hypothetical protein